MRRNEKEKGGGRDGWREGERGGRGRGAGVAGRLRKGHFPMEAVGERRCSCHPIAPAPVAPAHEDKWLLSPPVPGGQETPQRERERERRREERKSKRERERERPLTPSGSHQGHLTALDS